MWTGCSRWFWPLASGASWAPRPWPRSSAREARPRSCSRTRSGTVSGRTSGHYHGRCSSSSCSSSSGNCSPCEPPQVWLVSADHGQRLRLLTRRWGTLRIGRGLGCRHGLTWGIRSTAGGTYHPCSCSASEQHCRQFDDCCYAIFELEPLLIFVHTLSWFNQRCWWTHCPSAWQGLGFRPVFQLRASW